MRKLLLVVLIVFCGFLMNAVHAQFRIVGYVHAWGSRPDLSRIPFDKITHLNIAFVNPDSTGNLKVPYGFDAIIKAAKKNNVKVLVSIGGGSKNPFYASLLSDARREEFLNKLIRLSQDFQLDGIDVDLENEAIDKNYPHAITYLHTRLKADGKLLTAALASWNGEKIPDTTLQRFDFINVMSYDQTGPWNTAKPGQHSSYEKAVEDLEYWTATRQLAPAKINLGLPFYGHCFGTQFGESLPYSNIIQTFPGSQNKDSISPKTGGKIYYNGAPTIRKKTALARRKAGGVMIWQLLQDDAGTGSLLNVVHKEAGR